MRAIRKLPSVLCSTIAFFSIAVGILNAAPQPDRPPRVLTRVFYQDDESRSLKWADLLSDETVRLGARGAIQGFPMLDTKRQSLVQMEAARGMLLVGVRDDDDGTFQSGWILIDTGVDQEEHGDHSHWSYPRVPSVRATMIDTKQGNPAHLYCYDDVFYLANDKLDGFTRLDPAAISPSDDPAKIRDKAIQFRGGGGHITLAAVDKKTAYSSWIDRDGPNKGRIDVTSLDIASDRQVDYSFFLPHGGIHGAISCQGKVFLAPSDGICWITANADPKCDPKQVVVNHISLGKEGEKPRRVGSFNSWGKCVGFVTGSGPNAVAGFIDAGQSQISVVQVPLKMAEGLRPVGPAIVKPRHSAPLAFVFHDHPADVSATCQLSLIELSCAKDGSLAAAKILHATKVGDCRVDGHSGHHAVDFDGDRRRAVFTNPGDGTLTLFSLEERKAVAEFKVGGIPSKIVCVGGAGSGH